MVSEANNFSWRELPAVLRRRRTSMLVVFGVILLASLAAALLWPSTYQATGTILIEQQEVPADLVRSTISSYADQRIQVIRQQVMTTENLYRIIMKYDLYAQERRSKARELIIVRMRDKDIRFKTISADVIDPRSGQPTKATIAFAISYESRSPEIAARVANELVSLFLQQNIESRKQRTADAAGFLDDEANRLSQRITELQGKVATFKERNINGMPELSQLNIQQLNRTLDEKREVDTRVRSLDQQIVYLEAQLAQISPTSQVYTSTGERVLSPQDRLKYLRTEYARVSGVYAPEHPDVVRLKKEIDGLEQSAAANGEVNDLQRQLEGAQTQLASMREKYSADHPDVVRQERLIDSLQERLLEAQMNGDGARAKPPEPDNPAYIQIKAQREAAFNERASLLQKRAALTDESDKLEKRMASAPAVEREYLELTREMDNNQLKYREVRQKQMEAEVAQNLEQERKGERFTLIEPPQTPEEPASPNRTLIWTLGVVLALGGAAGIAALREITDPSVRNRRDLEALLDVAPLAVLPWIETAAERAARARVQRFALIGAACSMVVLVTLVHVFYRPLDVVWQIALRKLAG